MACIIVLRCRFSAYVAKSCTRQTVIIRLVTWLKVVESCQTANCLICFCIIRVMASLLELLIIVSEKAANIARACRDDKDLFSLLVQEKKSDESNTRFIQDFKTLADVLIQETVRYDIEKLFPTLGKYIKGEENNIFTNVLGETIEISVQQTENETADLLKIVLDGNSNAASILAAEVHRTISLSDINVGNSSIPEDIHLDTDNLSIWIDPIDSTAEYIHGKESNDDDDIHVTGLRCVTVLLGGYNKDTGVPVIGVVNQPFHQQIGTRWQGKCFWGLSNSELDSSSLQDSTDRTNIVTISKIETKVIKTKLKEAGFTLIEASGAGYKLLTVITGLADAYIVSQGTTFQWDICGPHAILRSIGGGLYDYAKIVEGEKVEMNYKDNVSGDSKMNKYCNKNGLVATKNEEVLLHISNILRK